MAPDRELRVYALDLLKVHGDRVGDVL